MEIPTPEFLRSRWFLFLSLLLVGYTFFILGKMVYQNYKINQQIKSLEKEVLKIEKENQHLSDLISFFQTETFKEREVREKLGLVKPGEKVLVFPESEGGEESFLEEKTFEEKQGEQEKIPNWQKWWNFFFK